MHLCSQMYLKNQTDDFLCSCSAPALILRSTLGPKSPTIHMLVARVDLMDAGEGNLFGLCMSIHLAVSDSCFKQIDEHKQYAHA